MNKNETLITLFVVGVVGCATSAIFLPIAVTVNLLNTVAIMVALYLLFGD